MKKKLAMLLVAVMTFSFVACGSQNPSGNEGAAQESEEAEPEVVIGSALEVLETVWGGYDEANKFPVGGGDSANMNFEGAAKFDATNADELDVTLGFPAANVSMIDDAASMMNMMMANNFTAGVFHVTDSANVQVVADALKENILARQWMCGMPEQLIIVSVGDYVISAFGLTDAISTFKTEIQEAYSVANVLYEEGIS